MTMNDRTVRVTVKTTIIETRTVDIPLDECDEEFRDLVENEWFEEQDSGEREIDFDVEDSDFDSAIAEREGELGEDGAYAEVTARTIEWVQLLPAAPPARPASPHAAGVDDRGDMEDEIAAAGDAWRDEQEMS